MLVHICHSVSFTYKCIVTKSKMLRRLMQMEKVRRRRSVISSLWFVQTADNCEIVMSAFYTGPLAGSDLG